jgi:hypothetical protein
MGVRRVTWRGSFTWGVIFSTAVALIAHPSVRFCYVLLNYQAKYDEESGQL